MILDEVWGAQCCTEVRPAIGSDVDSGVSEDCLCVFQVLVLGHQPCFHGVGEIAIAWAFSFRGLDARGGKNYEHEHTHAGQPQ